MFYVAAIGVLTGGLATPASAQFDPLHNNLKCYKITGGVLTVNLQLDNQFGRERVAHLVPQFLCAPTQKTCCAAGATTTVCQPIPCPAEPSTNQPAAVDHFKCYKIQVKECTPTATNDFDCSKLTGRFPPAPPAITATLVDQFHTENVTLSKPKMLCVPVLKIRQGTTTTTATTSTTTTTRVCGLQNGNPPVCGGDCPTLQTCLWTGTMCMCSDTPCQLTGATCGGLCPSPQQQCHSPGTNPCTCCFNPGVPCTTDGQCCSNSCNASTMVCD